MAKGGSYENTISKELSLLWSKGERNDLIRRTEGSGARFSNKRKVGEEGTVFQAGDITFSNDIIKPLFEFFSFECKHGYSRKTKTDDGLKVVNYCALDIIDSKQKEPTILQMWNQCQRDAELSGREPVLIFRRDNKSSCIVLQNKLYQSMKDSFGLHDYKIIVMITGCYDEKLIIMNFNDWKSWVGEGLEAFINLQLNIKKGYLNEGFKM